MKTIYSILIAIMLLAPVAMSLRTGQPSETKILIKSSDKNISSAALDNSARVISGRLKDYNSGKFGLTVRKDDKQIEIVLNESPDLKIVENLILRKGSAGFYETLDHKSLAEILKGDNRLFSLFPEANSDNSEAVIGCIPVSEKNKVMELVNSLNFSAKCKFAWHKRSSEPDMCLYALRTDEKNGASVTGKDIESAMYNDDRIQITFKKDAIKVFSDMTHRNMNKDIALVIDDEVIWAPKVKSAIDFGKVEITGRFNPGELKCIAAILNNGELPSDFFIIR